MNKFGLTKFDGGKMNQNAKANTKRIVWTSVGVLMVILGFIFLGTGPAENPVSLTIAPIVLVVAYLVVIPIGIMAGGNDPENKGD